MNSNFVLMQVLFFALAGWLATSVRLLNSRYKVQTRRFLIIPLWFVWMTFALGGPVFQGTLPLSQAVSSGVGLTAGMLMFIVMRRLKYRRSR
jgi:hypothetical protein